MQTGGSFLPTLQFRLIHTSPNLLSNFKDASCPVANSNLNCDTTLSISRLTIVSYNRISEPAIFPNTAKITMASMRRCIYSDVLGKLLKMVSEKRLDVLRLDSLNAEELKSVAKEIGISTAKKSLTFILEEVKAVTKIFLAGQGILLTIFLRISRPKDILES